MAVDHDLATVRYDRRTTRILFDLLAAPLATLLFVAVGVIFADAWFAQARYVFLFFAALLAVASVVSWRRGIRRQLLDVGPEGLRTPELGQLAWEAA